MTSMLDALRRIDDRRPCVPFPEPSAPEVVEEATPAEPAIPAAEEEAAAPHTGAVEEKGPRAWDLEEFLARPTNADEDPYRQLAANVLSQLDPSRSSALLFGGPSGVPGKTTAVARLARMLSDEVQGGILSVDVDLGRPTLGNLFAAETGRGLGDVLLGTADWQDVVQPTDVPGLHLLSGRPFAADGLLGRLDPSWLLDELKQRFRLVLLNAGSLTPEEFLPWARRCDGSYLVAGLGTTTARAARRAVRQIKQSGGRVLGCVLTREQ